MMRRRRAGDRKIAMLREVAGLNECRDQELVVLAGIVDEVEVAAGTVLAAEGRPWRDLGLVVSGDAEVRRNGTVLWELGPGDLFCELALLGPAPAATTIVARTPMRLLVFSPQGRSEVFQLPSLARWACTQLGQRVCDMIGAPSEWPAGTATPPRPVETLEPRVLTHAT